MVTLGEEGSEMRGGFGNRVRRGNADNVEALALAIGDQEGFRLVWILDQKSRSA